MKTILCPVDFTLNCDSLVKYVSALASDRNSKIYLISTHTQKKELVLAGAHSGDGLMEEVHDYLSGILHIPCGVVGESLSGNLYKKLGSVADGYDIMAIMVNASDKKNSYMHLKKIVRAALAPILVIPEGFVYQPVKRLLYAYDYKHEKEPPLMQLNWLSDWFNAPMVFVTLIPGISSIKEEREINVIQTAIRNSWKDSHSISFETIMYPNLPDGFENYIGMSEMGDLLMLSINHRNILERIWYQRIVKGVLQFAKRPYLIIHE